MRAPTPHPPMPPPPPIGSSLVESTVATVFAGLAVLGVLRTDLRTALIDQFQQLFWLISLPF